MQELKFRARDYDIIGIVETHANKNINDAELSLEGFNLYRLDRQDKRGGGLVINVNSRLKSSLCTDIYSAGFEESLWCIILTDYGSLLVGLCYRCPSSDGTNNDKLLELFEAAADYYGCTNVMIWAILIIQPLTLRLTQYHREACLMHLNSTKNVRNSAYFSTYIKKLGFVMVSVRRV